MGSMDVRTHAAPDAGLAARARAASPWLLAAAAMFAFQLFFFDRWFSFMDEGHILAYADLIARGGALYRDATVYPLPGAFWLLALAFRIFEPTILLARWIVVIEYTLFTLLVLAWLRRLVSPPWLLAAFAALLLYRVWSFPHWHMYSYSTTALLVLLAALLGVLRFFETSDRRWLALAGFTFGLGVLCKQDYGAAVLLAVSAALVVFARTGGRREPLLRLFATFLGPAALVGAATGLYFWRTGLLADVIRLTVTNHFVGMASYDYPALPSLFPLFGQDPVLRDVRGRDQYMPAIVFTADWDAVRESWLYLHTALYDFALKLFYFAPYPLVLFALLRLWRSRAALAGESRRRQLAELLLVFTAAALVLMVSFNRPQDYVHLVALYWPLIALGVVFACAGFRSRRRLAVFAAIALLLPAAAFVAYSARLVTRLAAEHWMPIESPRAGIRVLPVEARMLGEVVDYIQSVTQPGEAIAVMPYFPILHFLAERPAPHRSTYIVWPFPELADRDAQIERAMDAQPTRLVIYNFTQFAVFPPLTEFAPDLYAYLVDHYELGRVFSYDKGGYVLGALTRAQDAPAGRALVGPSAAELSVSIESDDEPPRPVRPEERAALLSVGPWPFRPALALAPAEGGRRTVATLPLDVPRGAHLRTAVAVNPRIWIADPFEVRFALEAALDGRRETLYERVLAPATRREDRGWFDVDVPLDAFAGRRITLALSTAVDVVHGDPLLLAGWAEPRLVQETR
jgi:hypothetical protein